MKKLYEGRNNQKIGFMLKYEKQMCLDILFEGECIYAFKSNFFS